MKFDLRTCDAAYYFVLRFMGMTPEEYITEMAINCGNDFETFWDRNIQRIKAADISELKIMAFHVVGSLDGCEEIRTNGLMNLQKVLSSETILKRMLDKAGIIFNIENKTVTCNGETYDIDYEKYRGRHLLSGQDEGLSNIAHRVYYDHCVNGFLANDNIYDYGTDIHERPEFLLTLGHVFPQAEKLAGWWRKESESYRIDFFATVNQVHRFNFELDEFRDPPYEGWVDLDDSMKLKKWMLSHAIDRANNDLDVTFLYVKDEVSIPPDQILSISKL